MPYSGYTATRAFRRIKRPVNRFVAGFIGSPSMNFVPASFNGAGKSHVTVDGASIEVKPRASVTDGQKVALGIRPEHLDLADDGIPVTVSVIEPTGSETHVICRHADAEIVAVFKERHQFKIGQLLHLRPKPEFVHLFDETSGARLV